MNLPEDLENKFSIHPDREFFKPLKTEAKLNSNKKAFKILLLDLSQHFESEKDYGDIEMVEPPLGLLYLMTLSSERIG